MGPSFWTLGSMVTEPSSQEREVTALARRGNEAGVKGELDRRRQAGRRPARYATHRERIGKHTGAGGKRKDDRGPIGLHWDRKQVDRAPVPVTQDGLERHPRSHRGARIDGYEAQGAKSGERPWLALVAAVDDDVEVMVPAGLVAQQGVNAPTSCQPGGHARAVERIEAPQHIAGADLEEAIPNTTSERKPDQ